MRFTKAALIMFAMLNCCGVAQAEVDGSVPGPGLCSYPNVGSSGMDFGVYHYVCDGPLEINGSHWHCEYGGAAGNGSVGASIAPIGIGVTATAGTNIGVLEGSCSWRCPNNTMAAAPNPPLAWQGGNPMTAKCKTVGAAPIPAWMSDPQRAPGPANPLAPPLPPGPMPVPPPAPTTVPPAVLSPQPEPPSESEK